MKLEHLLADKKVILLDGGLGTELARRGCEMSGLSNMKNSGAVVAIHEDYRLAGSDILLTNTFTLNRISVEARGLDVDVRKINAAAVQLAREASEGKCLVFGDIGPTGKLLQPYGDYSETQFYDCYTEQVQALIEAGADGIMIETITDLREGICALRAAKDHTELPILLSLAFSTTERGGRTVMGSSVEEAAVAAEELGAAAVGANCGDLDPAQMAEIVLLFKNFTGLPIVIQPNAGIPKLVRGETIFDMEPQEYAEGLMKCIEQGASIIGGCCGTTPAHIKEVALKIK